MTSKTGNRWFERFWAVAGAVSVRTKILGIVLGLVLMLGLGVTFQVRMALMRAMETQLEEQGVSVARDLAARSTDLILVNDTYRLVQLLLETKANNANVRYVFVVDPAGRVLGHTFGEGFPRALVEANSVAGEQHHQTVVLSTDEGPIWDTAVPIFNGRAGTARVGMTEAALQQALASVTGQLLLTTAVVSAVGIGAAALLTWILTRPILNLARAADAVGRGDLTQRVHRWADDEIGMLAEAFNSMTEALARAAEARRERESLRAQFVSGVIAAQEDERKRIARELHDSTSQSLTTLLVGLRAIANAQGMADVRRQVEEMRSVVGQTLDEVHTMALHLRPSVLDDLGLPAALERYAAECRRRYGLRVELAIHGLGSLRLPPAVETALYRIVQEGLTNVARHARARVASVLLEAQADRVRAIVEDDGQGFDAAAVHPADHRLGLYGIRERAELLGGTLTVESAPGQGTTLFIEIPLQLAVVVDG